MEMIKKIMNNKNLVIFILGAILMLLFLKQCNKISSLKQDINYAKEEANINLNNLKASRDTITIIKNDYGDKVAEIRSFTIDLSKKDEDIMRLTNKYKRALNLSNDLKNVNTLISTQLKLKDSLLANTTVTQIDSNSAEIKFSNSDNYGGGNSRSLLGTSLIKYEYNKFKVLSSEFKLTQTLSLITAIENIDGVDKLKITTSYPGMEIKGIENINLINSRLNSKPEKKSGWSIGLGVGYGINLNNNQVISFGPSIGVGCFYSPKWLRF